MSNSKSACIITSCSDGSPHMLVSTMKIAKQYCKKNIEYDWECFVIHDVESDILK